MGGSVIEQIGEIDTSGSGAAKGVYRLHYKLISGTGPSTGWVNTDRIELMPSGSTCTTNVEFAKQYGTALFHQTDEKTASIILSTQEMKPGSKGLAGGGIYFAN